MRTNTLIKLADSGLPPPSPLDHWMQKPFSVIDLNDEVWTVTTDRAWFFAVHTKSKYALCKAQGTSLHTIQTLLGVQPKDTMEASTKALASYEGKVVVQDVPVDATRLSRILELVSDEKIQVWNATEKVGILCLGLTSGKWKAFLAGVREAPDAPVFQDNKQSLYDLAMEMG